MAGETCSRFGSAWSERRAEDDQPADFIDQQSAFVIQKGIYEYARARAGELEGLTGVGAPYERPSEPDLVLGSDSETVEREVERVMGLLVQRGVLADAS